MLCFKDNGRTFSRNSNTQRYIRISRLRKSLQNLCKKENFKPEIKSIIKNLQDELSQFQNKQANGAKPHAKIKWELEGEKCSKPFFKVLESRNIQNQTQSKLYIDDNKSKHSSNSTDILKSAKYFYKKLYNKETSPKTVTNKFLSKISNRKKISNEKFYLCEAKIL